jgi:uroporphyrin-III C-methyltransferase
MTTTNYKKGYVILAGAGPGDPDLVTYKTIKHLQSADIVLVDRLVSPEIISNFCNPNAEVIYVGKNGNDSHHTTPQSKINQLIVDYALKGNKVVRLKGGDTSVFSNIYDELITLKKYDIHFEIVPGVSAAFGAGAYAGMPLTARGYSRGIRLLTLCNLESVDYALWADWAKTTDTLVFYMSGLKVKNMVDNLTQIDANFNKSIAIIEQATTKEQKTHLFKYKQYDLLNLFTFKDVPTIIIVGKVTELHEEFSWFEEKDLERENYFINTNLLKNAI